MCVYVCVCVCGRAFAFRACARRRATLRCQYVRHFSGARTQITWVKMQTLGASLPGDGPMTSSVVTR